MRVQRMATAARFRSPLTDDPTTFSPRLSLATGLPLSSAATFQSANGAGGAFSLGPTGAWRGVAFVATARRQSAPLGLPSRLVPFYRVGRGSRPPQGSPTSVGRAFRLSSSFVLASGDKEARSGYRKRGAQLRRPRKKKTRQKRGRLKGKLGDHEARKHEYVISLRQQS